MSMINVNELMVNKLISFICEIKLSLIPINIFDKMVKGCKNYTFKNILMGCLWYKKTRNKKASLVCVLGRLLSNTYQLFRVRG